MNGPLYECLHQVVSRTRLRTLGTRLGYRVTITVKQTFCPDVLYFLKACGPGIENTQN